MTDSEQRWIPDDLPRSPSGRVPQWVLYDRQRLGPAPTDRRSRGLHARKRQRPRRSPGGWAWLPWLLSVTVSVGVLVVRSGQLPQAPGAFAASRPANTPSPGFEEADGRLGLPPTPAASPAYRFSATQDDGTTPVTYDPCRPIHYVTRPDGAPSEGDALIAAAVAQVSAATGLRFVSDGHTTESPVGERVSFQPARYGDRWAPVLIVWETANEQPDFGVDVAGLGGSTRLGWGDHPARYVTGMIQLDASKLGSALTRSDGRQRVQSVILHELGHLVGLAHINDPQQLMYPRGSTANGFGSGDLAGLAQLGTGQCAPWL